MVEHSLHPPCLPHTLKEKNIIKYSPKLYCQQGSKFGGLGDWFGKINSVLNIDQRCREHQCRDMTGGCCDIWGQPGAADRPAQGCSWQGKRTEAGVWEAGVASFVVRFITHPFSSLAEGGTRKGIKKPR